MIAIDWTEIVVISWKIWIVSDSRLIHQLRNRLLGVFLLGVALLGLSRLFGGTGIHERWFLVFDKVNIIKTDL